MDATVVEESLASITSEEDFADRGYAMTEGWRSLAVSADAIKPILRFIEAHPDWDLGSPGALVHFVEQFLGPAYEVELVASVRRKPTALTLWMLNRVINGERDSERRAQFIALMTHVASMPELDPEVATEARHFIDFQRQKN